MRTPFCSYCYLLRVHVKKNIEKTLLMSAGAQKKVKDRGFWEYFTVISTEF